MANAYKGIIASRTVVVSNTYGELYGISLNTNGGVVAVYDGLNASGILIGSIAADAPEGVYLTGLRFNTGLTVVTGATCDVTVMFSGSGGASFTPTSHSASLSPSLSPSVSPSVSPSASLSPSVSPSVSPSASLSPSVSPSRSASLSPSISPSISPSLSPSVSPSASISPSLSPSVSPSASISPSVSPSNSPSPSPSEGL